MSEQLERILKAGDGQRCAEFFRGMPERQRRALAPQVIASFRKDPQRSKASAVYATATLSEIKKLGWMARPGSDLAFQVLEDRRPDWIDRWVITQLDDSDYWRHWHLVRRLVRAGVARKPDHPSYYLGMIGGLHPPPVSHTSAMVEQSLLDDPELLQDEVWHLFELEGGGENSLANVDRFSSDQSWSTALLSLMRHGHLPRERLLSCSLDALERDFNHYRARWFATFHDQLEPSNEERRQAAPRYLRLLAVSAPNIVSWAFTKVGELDQEQALPLVELCHGLRPVMVARSKGIVTKALGVLRRTAGRSPAAAIEAAQTAVVALGHESAEVQEAALGLLEGLEPEKHPELARAVAAYADVIAPSLRSRLAAWVTDAGDGGPGPENEAGETPDLAELDRLDPQLLELYAIPALVEHRDQGRIELPAAVFDGTEVQRLHLGSRLTPIEDLEELIDVCARVIERDEEVDDAERAIDGLSRLCDQRPDGFQALLAPLLKRATDRLKGGMAPFLGIGPADDVCGLVYAWGTGIAIEHHRYMPRPGSGLLCFKIDGEHHPSHSENTKKVVGFLSRRSHTLARRVARGHAAPLLSGVTHTGGWIDPQVLVARVNELGAGRPDVADVCLAMLRLAPDGRTRALAGLEFRDDEWVRAIRHALGAAGVRVGRSAPLWIAAARARAPWSHDEAVERRFPAAGPDAGSAAAYSFSCSRWESGHVDLTITTTPPSPSSADPDCPTLTFHSRRGTFRSLMWELGSFAGRTVGTVRWTATVWPLARESYCAAAAHVMADNLDWWEAHWENRTMLEPLLDSLTPLRSMGLLLLAVALAAKEPGERGLATDIAIRAIEDGRLGSDNLGAMLCELLPTGLIKPGRWQGSLAEIAGGSRVHALVVQRALQRALAGLQADQLHREVSRLLDLLKELSIELGLGMVEPGCRDLLAGIKGGGKTAKIARELLGLKTSSDNRSLMDEALRLRINAALEVRLAPAWLQGERGEPGEALANEGSGVLSRLRRVLLGVGR